MTRFWRWVLAAAALALLSILLLRSLDGARLAEAFRSVEWQPVVGAVLVCLFPCLGTAALRLQVLLHALPSARQISLGRLFALYLTSSAAQQLLVGPAAEIIRTVHLSRQYGYALEDVAAAHVVEKVIDAITLTLVVLALVALSGLPSSMRRPLVVFLAMLGASIIIIVVLAHRAPRASGESQAQSRVHRFLDRVFTSFRRLQSPSVWAAAIAWSCLSAAANAATMGLVLSAVGQPRPIGAWLASLLAARLSGLVPTTPGQLGVQEGGVMLVLGSFGVDSNHAIAAALIYRAVHALPVFLAGMLSLRSLLRERGADSDNNLKPCDGSGS